VKATVSTLDCAALCISGLQSTCLLLLAFGSHGFKDKTRCVTDKTGSLDGVKKRITLFGLLLKFPDWSAPEKVQNISQNIYLVE
jgi:hypothetical protein